MITRKDPDLSLPWRLPDLVLITLIIFVSMAITFTGLGVWWRYAMDNWAYPLLILLTRWLA